MEVQVSHVRITIAPLSLKASGLLAWARVRLDGRWEVDGIAVRRDLQGEVRVTFPARKDGAGKCHPYFVPLDESERMAIERSVIAALRNYRRSK